MFFVDNVVDAVENKVVGAIGSALRPGNANDPKRAAAAKAALEKAAAGSVPDAIYMIAQRFGSATAYGKQQFEIAWAQLLQRNPAVAAEALKQYPQVDPVNTAPSVRDKLAAEWNSLVAKIRADVGTTVQRVGAGVATGVAGEIDPNTGRVTLPLSSSMIWIVVLVALAIAALFLLTKKKHA